MFAYIIIVISFEIVYLKPFIVVDRLILKICNGIIFRVIIVLKPYLKLFSNIYWSLNSPSKFRNLVRNFRN